MSNTNLVPLTCDKCSHTSELSMKQWEKHFHGVEYKCPKCDHILMKEEKVLQAMGRATGAIKEKSENKMNPLLLLSPLLCLIAWILLIYLAGSK